MSFINICGKILLCEHCESSLKVEYQEGSKSTQLGDFAIQELLWQSSQLGQPHENPDVDGYYVYFLAIGPCCVREHINDKMIDNTNRLNELLDELNEEREAHLAQVSTIANTALTQRLGRWKVLGDAEEELKTKLAHLRSQGKRTKALKHIISKRQEVFADLVHQDLNLGEALSALQDQFKQHCQKSYKKRLKELSHDGMVDYVTVIDPREPDSLNKWIETPMSVRIPVDDTPEILFFKQEQFNRSQVDQLMIFTEQDIKAHLIEISSERLLDKLEILLSSP